jgi:hypothetical protein
MKTNQAECSSHSPNAKSKIKNPALLGCSGWCWLHHDTNPKSVLLKLEEKSGPHGNPFLTSNVTITVEQIDNWHSVFY